MTPIILVVFDGLQPAQVTPELMPNLSRLASEGVTCSNHHAVFPTVTRANVASIVTGHLPGAHGLTANTLLIPEFDPHRAFGALEPTLSEVAARHPVLLQPTLGDILHEQSLEYIAVGAGTSGNAYLQNPNAETGGGATIHPDFTLPRSLNAEIIGRFGQWPDRRGPSAPKMARVVDVVTRYVLEERQPAVAMMWLSEPDVSQHSHGVGSPEALDAIREADRQFGRLLDWLEQEGRAAETDVIVASDHGYSTISEVIDVEAELRRAGFPRFHRGEPGGVAVAPNGGAVLFYVTDNILGTSESRFHRGSSSQSARLAEWLMGQPWCGPLLASGAAGDIEGSLPASLVGLDGLRAPALTMSFAWNSEVNTSGYAGHAYSTSLGPGQGQHGSMSPHETRNVMFARGPSFRQSAVVATPTGNADIAPTILRLLGLPGGEAMAGRVLTETLKSGPDGIEWRTETHNAERETEVGLFSQTIQVSRVGHTVYLDHGSSDLQPG